MDLILLVLMLALIGFAVWFITTKIPMDAAFRTIILVVVVVVVVVLVLYLLRRVGVAIPNLL